MSTRLDGSRLLVLGVGCAAAAIGALAGKSPSLALSVAMALAFVPIIFGRFTLGVGVFIFSTFLGLPSTAQKGIGGLVVLAALGVVIGSSQRLSSNFFAVHRRITLVLLAFLAWGFLGVTWATSTGDVMYSLSRYIPNFLTFFVIYAAVANRRDIVLVIGFFVLGAAVSAGDAILSPPPASAYADVTRVSGTFGDPNYLAAVLVTGFALSVALNRVRSFGSAAKIAAGCAAVLCLAGIVLSVSRGGLIALTVTLVAAICISGRWRLKLAGIGVMVAIVGVGYFGSFGPATLRDRITHSDGGSGRTTIWRVGWREVKANPVKGVGDGNFSVAGVRYASLPGAITHTATAFNAYFIDTPTVAHNTYLEVLAEGGIPGLGLFIGFVTASLWCMRRAWLGFRRSGDEDMEILTYGLFAGVLGFLVASFFLSEEYSKQLYVLLALGPALLKVSTATRSPSPYRVRQRRVPQRLRRPTPGYAPS